MDTQQAPFKATVSAIPSIGSARFRAGPKGAKLRWTKDPVSVIVTDSPDYKATPIAISFQDWNELQSDEQIRAIPVGGSDPAIAQVKGSLAKVQAEAEQLRADLANALEERRADAARWQTVAEEQSEKLRQAQAEIDNLRQNLSQRSKAR